MGRGKKKKSAASPSHSSKTDEISEVDTKLSSELRDRLDLQIVAASKGSAKDKPEVRLSQPDFASLDVANGDLVFLLLRDNEGKLIGPAICSVKVSTESEGTPRKSPIKTPTKKSHLVAGWCEVAPPNLADDLLNATVNVENEENKSEEVMLSSPSQSEGQFSFARGGGGGTPVAPRGGARHQHSNRTTQRTWVVPLNSPLGNKLSLLLCTKATKIVVEPISPIPSRSEKLLARLVIAYCGGRYVRCRDKIGISFQGKTLELHVKVVEEDTDDSLNRAFESMAIDGMDPMLMSVRDAMDKEDADSKLRLCLVSERTAVDVATATDSAVDKNMTRERLVAGLDDCLEQVKEALLPPLLQPDMYGSLKAPRGVLLHGPSGVGKSALAKQLCDEMEAKGVRAQFVHCTSLQSQTAVVGEAERYLTRLFRSRDRCLLVLDDVQLICAKRGGAASSPHTDRLAATLLALLDGVKSNSNVVVLAITANPSLLDPALRRPGRLDTEVEIPIPDETTRSRIIEFQLKTSTALHSLSQEELMKLSRVAKGFTGADCMLAIKEAMRRSAAMDDGVLTIAHLEESFRASKPSTINSVSVEIPTVHWSSIGGMDEVKARLRETIELPITKPHLFEALRIPPPRGVLLYGPPGCSKTLMARALATEGKMNFLAVKGPELLSKWLGESERALASLFRRARLASPCVIFFDEIDAIASSRGGKGSAGGERLLSQLLTELDGIGRKDAARVVVVGATNRPDLLDSALVRPGRIDRMIYVGLPDSHSRARIFEIGLKGKACAQDVDVRFRFVAFAFSLSQSVSTDTFACEGVSTCQ